MKPFIYYSSEVVKEFITDSLNRSMDDLAVQLEAYVMSGLKGMYQPTPISWPDSVSPGVVVNSKTKTLELKRKTTTLILEKLRKYTLYTVLKYFV